MADQDAHRQLGLLNAGLYRIGHGPHYHAAFHDITEGNNTARRCSCRCSAKKSTPMTAEGCSRRAPRQSGGSRGAYGRLVTRTRR
jgi:hypothetical protein